MNKLFTILSIAITLSACGSDSTSTLSRDEIVKQNAEAHLKAVMNDPTSYEFVSLKLVDSVLYKDNIHYRRHEHKLELERAKGTLL